jgi:hypothetical protein
MLFQNVHMLGADRRSAGGVRNRTLTKLMKAATTQMSVLKQHLEENPAFVRYRPRYSCFSQVGVALFCLKQVEFDSLKMVVSYIQYLVTKPAGQLLL